MSQNFSKLNAVIRLYRNCKSTGAEMRPVIASGTCRSATGQFFSLSLVTVPEIFANVNSFHFPSVSKVANENWKTTSLRASSPGRSGGGGKEGELATTSLEFEYLHRESRCEMLIGGDDISNDVITFGTWFSMFVYIRARFRFALIGGNLTAQSTGSHGGIGGGIQIPET